MSNNPYESPEQLSPTPAEIAGGWTFNPIRLLLTILVVGTIVVMLLLPMTRRSAPEAARRVQCLNNLKQIALALQNYHEVHGSLPPAYMVDAAGKPLHSWRTLILPYMEQKQLYDQIDLTKPWDDPANKVACDTKLSVYQCPSVASPDTKTTYLAIMGQQTCFDSSSTCKFTDITDGLTNTFMVVDAHQNHAVHWMSPQDITPEELLATLSEKKPQHPGIVQGAMADGGVRTLSVNLKPEAVLALTTIAGNDNHLLEE